MIISVELYFSVVFGKITLILICSSKSIDASKKKKIKFIGNDYAIGMGTNYSKSSNCY